MTAALALDEAAALLRTPPPDVDTAAAQTALQQHYDLSGFIEPLAGERDRNFLVTLADGGRRVLKFYNAADDAATREFQHGALIHMAGAATDCPVPRLFPTRDGGPECLPQIGAGRFPAILISCLPGVPAQPYPPTAALRWNLGRGMATLGLALRGFSHPQAKRVLLWDLMQLDRLRPVAEAVDDPARRAWLLAFVDRFVDDIRPKASVLPAQIIHNDLSGSNVLVADADPMLVTGIIDFGDMVHAPRINEIAVAASYFITPDHDPLAAIDEMVAGHESVVPLDAREIALLYDLIQARLTLRILMNRWRVALFPENATYILRNHEAAWRLVDGFARRDAQADRVSLFERWTTRRRVP